MGVAVLLLAGYMRVLRPLLMMRRPYRLVDKHEERGGAWTLELEPDGHDGMEFQPGQFAWLKIGASPFAVEEHPFSFSSSPDRPDRLLFTIKELGDFTGQIEEIPDGTRVYIDGPYGAFTFERFPAPGYVFLAGGIGITPIISMLRSLAMRGDERPLLLVNANKTWDEVTYREDYPTLERALDLRVVHVLDEPPPDWEGETGFVTAEMLDRLLPPNRARLQYFLCGPPPMVEAVKSALTELDIPLTHIQVEEFALV